ncbi:TetR family transcriptional regulator [Pseudofrankia inefficax]|uniref:Regulatory protein TetR n=1 Tax=Pseudofrankia inefficax (strain DSM 45817 / CECT 9037 / DDB 130130 / EuI1c) TaxID=298654 RepID=E3J421_PSEI1|nr:TetR family transcriptional regulator [Pseudofrankia inefficax]ADP81800.1 regulatory protein TetR [Pseudofrankia inefficax]
MTDTSRATPRAEGRPRAGRPPAATAADDPAAAGQRSREARERLLLTAEQLYAEQGIAAVSLRQICRAAGNGNNNAVQYHFGDERGLFEAIIAHRVPRLDRRRAELLAAARAAGLDQSVRGLVDVLFRPLAEEARRLDSSYVGFLGRFVSAPPDRHPWFAGGEPAGPVGHEVSLAILDRLPQAPAALRGLRLRHVVELCLAALAGFGQLPATSGSEAVAYDLFVTDLFDMAAAALTAASSAVDSPSHGVAENS